MTKTIIQGVAAAVIVAFVGWVSATLISVKTDVAVILEKTTNTTKQLSTDAAENEKTKLTLVDHEGRIIRLEVRLNQTD